MPTCFWNRIVNIWNNLPDSVVTAPPVATFRDRLRNCDLSKYVLHQAQLLFNLYGTCQSQVLPNFCVLFGLYVLYLELFLCFSQIKMHSFIHSFSTGSSSTLEACSRRCAIYTLFRHFVICYANPHLLYFKNIKKIYKETRSLHTQATEHYTSPNVAAARRFSCCKRHSAAATWRVKS